MCFLIDTPNTLKNRRHIESVVNSSPLLLQVGRSAPDNQVTSEFGLNRCCPKSEGSRFLHPLLHGSQVAHVNDVALSFG